jgi:hypothetical protein
MLGVLAGQFTGSVVQVAAAGSALADVGGAVLVEYTAGVFLIARRSASSSRRTSTSTTRASAGCSAFH